MSTIVITNARIVTLKGPRGPRRGEALADLGVIERGYLRIDDDRIAAVGPGDPPQPEEGLEGDIVDAGGAVLAPAFVDCHTHTCWAGSRFDEFEMSLRGATYLDILRNGGGIMSTVRAVRAADEAELAAGLLRRLAAMAALGTGAVEIKSGYGLDTETELKMLRAIHAVNQFVPPIIIGTFLGAHAIDKANPEFIDQTISETLPAVVQEFPGITCDAYCEQGAWSLKDTQRLFEAAIDLGCPIRVHADQFNSLGMTRLAIEMGAVSVDHLEATTPGELEQLAGSSTFGVALPCSGFHLDDAYAPARRFIDAGGALAIATNYNPGSAPTPSMPFTIALACRKLRLTPAEAITCATYNPACVLGIEEETGSLEVGKRADIQLLDCVDERELAFEFATAGPLVVMLGGQIVHTRAVEREEEEPTGDEDEGEAEQ
ncbi:MAG: imidazolonepropionase [Planctomycetota bacterium]|nr:imidazolonepropionase [Planctomycetota bacterium]